MCTTEYISSAGQLEMYFVSYNLQRPKTKVYKSQLRLQLLIKRKRKKNNPPPFLS